jgi:predicted DNA-binding transcriptional regulator YafY
VTCHIRADSDWVALECALGLGDRAEVVEPAELRERVEAAAGSIVARSQAPTRAARILSP